MAHRRIGNLEVSRVLELIMPFDRQMFFPDTKEEDWAPHLSWLQPDAVDPRTGDILLPMQSYIVRTSHHTILIDTCVGNHKDRPTRPQWHMKTDDTYHRGLARHGVAVEEVDYVLCTHLHGDHVGWNTRLEDGRWVPTFPNARYVFSRKEVDAWEKGHPSFSRGPLEDSVLPVIAAGRADLVESDHAIDDEVWLEPTPGHTPDHFAVGLASGDARAVMCGDLMHSPIQCLYPDWRPWPDWDPVQAAHTRRAFLDRYCETDTVVCTAHFPLPSAGHIVRDGDGCRMAYDTQAW